MTELKVEDNRQQKEGPFHKFFCRKKGNIRSYRTYYSETPDVKINDDFIRYINDTLLWVPSVYISGSKSQKNYGLMLYGTTVIKKEGAKTFGDIMGSWADLFSKGPANLYLQCGIVIKDDGNLPGSRSFHTIELERDEVVKSLRTLAEYAELVATGDYFILHLGI